MTTGNMSFIIIRECITTGHMCFPFFQGALNATRGSGFDQDPKAAPSCGGTGGAGSGTVQARHGAVEGAAALTEVLQASEQAGGSSELGGAAPQASDCFFRGPGPRRFLKTRGNLFATFCEKMGDPLNKESFTMKGVDHFSTKAGKQKPLLKMASTPQKPEIMRACLFQGGEE